ncbi:MAG: site-2 protease family protein [Thermoguttaceae bacterium]
MIAVSWYLNPGVWLAIGEVAVGLGLVIFVHELGHFAVAKLCGVKVEKFYLGFDIAGLKLARFRRGETEYGIGILPLGGYVKMLGQEDNPARLRQEIERARLEGGGGKAEGGGETAQTRRRGDAGTRDHGPGPSPIPNPQSLIPSAPKSPNPQIPKSLDEALFDPRSYLAQSVPRRMAIISAGVIMNMIFALVVAVIASGLGVRQTACGIGQVLPGGGAWQAGIRVGDRILEVGGQKVQTFRDVLETIVLGDVQNGVEMVVKRPGRAQPLRFTVKTQRMAGRQGIGIGSSSEPRLTQEKELMPAVPGTAASQAAPPFHLGDRFLSINDQPIASYAEIQAYLALHPAEPLTVAVARAETARSGPASAQQQHDETESAVAIRVEPNHMRQFGLTMNMGQIAAIQEGSPAEHSGIRPGDILRTADSQPVGDPLLLPDRLRALAGREVTLGLERDGQPVQVRLRLRQPDQYCPPSTPRSPVAVPELGLAYKVRNSVAAVVAGGPADQAGLRAGDVLREATILPPDEAKLRALQQQYHQPDLEQYKDSISFDGDLASAWPYFMEAIQGALPGTTVKFEWTRATLKESSKVKGWWVVEDEPMSATLEPLPAADWFNPSRGWLFEPETLVQTAGSFGKALRWGAKETVNAALMVYRTIRKIGTGDVSPRNLGGPVSIFLWARHEAEQGMGNLLLFLTLLSANLAVLNFLPIPLLDGGHFVLLLWEGIRGKPADERVQEVLTYIGLALILALMVFALGLDFGLISRPGR